MEKKTDTGLREDWNAGYDPMDYIGDFTRVHQKWWKRDPFRCETECLKLQMEVLMMAPGQNDLFLGRVRDLPIGFTPQVYTDRGGFGYFFDPDKIPKGLWEAHAEQLNGFSTYWQAPPNRGNDHKTSILPVR